MAAKRRETIVPTRFDEEEIKADLAHLPPVRRRAGQRCRT
jgi:hypothetical protein